MTELKRTALLICKMTGMLSNHKRDFGELALVQSAIENEIEWTGCSLPEAAKHIADAAVAAQHTGECVNRFWFIDRRWRHQKSNPDTWRTRHGERQTSPAIERSVRIKRNILNAFTTGAGD